MATTMIAAHGDFGPELVDAADAVEIPVLPLAPGNLPVPATIRFLGRPLPTRLTGISRAGRPWPFISWRNARGERDGCYVRNTAEAQDAIFRTLPLRSQQRILNAIRAGQVHGREQPQ